MHNFVHFFLCAFFELYLIPNTKGMVPIYMYLLCVFVLFLKAFTALSVPDPRTQLWCAGEYCATARHTAMHGTNLNLHSNLSIFSHPFTACWQLKFFVQSLFDELCK